MELSSTVCEDFEHLQIKWLEIPISLDVQRGTIRPSKKMSSAMSSVRKLRLRRRSRRPGWISGSQDSVGSNIEFAKIWVGEILWDQLFWLCHMSFHCTFFWAIGGLNSNVQTTAISQGVPLTWISVDPVDDHTVTCQPWGSGLHSAVCGTLCLHGRNFEGADVQLMASAMTRGDSWGMRTWHSWWKLGKA